MEFDTSKKPHDSGERKEHKKSKKRTPARVPLPLDEKNKESASVKKVEKEAVKKIRPPKRAHHNKHTELVAAEMATEAVTPLEKDTTNHEKGAHSELESAPTPSKSGNEIAPRNNESVSEHELPLHVHAEGEVFVSERLKSDQAEDTDDTASQADEIQQDEESEVSSSAEGASEHSHEEPQERTTSDAHKETDSTTARSDHGQKSKRASTQAGATAAGTASFLSQWRTRKSSGGQPPRNPQPPTGGGNVPPVPPRRSNPNASSGSPNAQPLNHNTTPITRTPVAERVRDRASERRHLVTGLVVGALVEHVRHKRREKRMRKEHAEKVAGLQKDQAQSEFDKKQASDKALREKTALEQTLDRMKKQLSPESSTTPVLVAEKSPRDASAAQPKAEKSINSADTVKTAEQARKEMEERARRAVEELHAETLAVPEGHHIEQSSWHAIEVDNKTNRAVEHSAITYGKAFEQERHQEQLHQVQNGQDKTESSGSDTPLSAMVFPGQSDAVRAKTNRPTQKATENTASRAAGIVRAAAQQAARVQPIDALLWVILGIIVLIILKLL